ncbi:unnamed protein product [Trichogramma brassicae]|uniref:Saposin A-type domain-containing protein n=1 Tax=Trichogramma brassicae TaxID=86971 RepID=A0A6H5IZG6_9HYME|nr:unnamed protein product [Trichogramma brassicae]
MVKVTNLKIKLLALVFAIIFCLQIFKLWSFYHEKTQKVLVKVYYEALCSDSRNFIIKQLLPTYNTIENYMDVQLIPYGKAETIVTNDDYVFKCQHGEPECQANIIHACSIHFVHDPRKQLELISCMIKNNMYPMSILKSCAEHMKEYKAILDCSISIEGRRLLMKYGEMTNELSPKVDFIPTITLDNDHDNQILILKNLMRQVCQRIKEPPRECVS